MKTKKSLLVVPAIALVFALVFTTCSNGGGGGGNQGSTQGQLAFERITDGENAGTWRVRKGTVTGGKVVIPAYYNGSTGRAARSAEDGDSVTEIGWKEDTDGNGAFSGADITEIIIPNTIKSIGYYAFQDCPNLTSITIPASVEYIGLNVFSSNRNLKNIIVEDGNPNYTAEGGVLYATTDFNYFPDITGKVLHSWPSAKGNVIIPAGVLAIGFSAFSHTEITSVTIHETVMRLGNQAFDYAYSLTSITVADGNPNFSSEGGILYNKAKTEIIKVPNGKSGSVTIPASVTTIPDVAFNGCGKIKSITIPNTVTKIGNMAFGYCTSISAITIPESVTSVGDIAFYEWTSSQTINIRGHANQAAADAAWGAEWRRDIKFYGEGEYEYVDIAAKIKYWNGSSYQ